MLGMYQVITNACENKALIVWSFDANFCVYMQLVVPVTHLWFTVAKMHYTNRKKKRYTQDKEKCSIHAHSNYISNSAPLKAASTSYAKSRYQQSCCYRQRKEQLCPSLSCTLWSSTTISCIYCVMIPALHLALQFMHHLHLPYNNHHFSLAALILLSEGDRCAITSSTILFTISQTPGYVCDHSCTNQTPEEESINT